MRSLSAPSRFALALTAGGALWLSLLSATGNAVAAALLPALRAELALLTPQYRLIDLRVAHRGEDVIEVDVATRRELLYPNGAVPSGTVMTASTLVGHLLQPVILLLSALTAPALLGRLRLSLALALTLLAAMLVIAADVPFVLAGALDDLTHAIGPAPAPSPLVAWMNFLNGGGRLALAAAAAVAVSAVSWKAAR